MLPEEKEMEVLEVYDLTQSYRDTAQLCGVDHHTVARAVAQRAQGLAVAQAPAPSKLASAFIDKVDEWVTRSDGRIRADVVHEKLAAMGYVGSERTTRRVVAALKKSFRHSHHRVYKPWLTEPGGWLQYDFGAGPVVEGIAVVLFCAWLAWSRFRIVVALADKSLPSVIAALDQSFRAIGGAPTYVLTDNEKTVTDRHIAGIAVRNRTAVDVARYYGVTIATCVPFDPETKAWATDCTSWLDGWEDVVAWVVDHRRCRTRTHPAALRRAA
jgi:transposase